MVTDEQRSVHTVMVYLNEKGAYMGGDTAFYAPDPAGALDTDMCEVAKTRGEIGSGLVFQHQAWHAVRKWPLPPTTVANISDSCLAGAAA